MAILGIYLYGRRWQTALSRGIAVDVSLVQRWAAGKRPVSRRAASLVISLARSRHLRREHEERERYLQLAAAMPAPVQVSLLAVG